jgi:hypothetical protein
VDKEHLAGWYSEVDNYKVYFLKEQYRRPIPLPVLLTIEKILTEVPDAHFYISQSADENADPFLNVTGRNCCHFIVERWNEPNYQTIGSDES